MVSFKYTVGLQGFVENLKMAFLKTINNLLWLQVWFSNVKKTSVKVKNCISERKMICHLIIRSSYSKYLKG